MLLQKGCVVRSEPLCLLPIYRVRAVYEHQIYSQRAHSSYHEEIFAEFHKKCIGLETLPAPLIGSVLYKWTVNDTEKALNLKVNLGNVFVTQHKKCKCSWVLFCFMQR